MGMFVLPSSHNCFLEWHGVYLIKQGIYNSSIIKFKIEFPKGYPRVMPDVTFQSKVYHPLVNWTTGRLNLGHEFKEWIFGKCWVINVLLFIKKIFHLEDCYNLKSHQESNNRQALELYIHNFPLFVNKCQECVELSIKEKFTKNENLASFPFSEPEALHNNILDKIKDFLNSGDDFKAKEALSLWLKQNLPD